jgi:xylulokinase
MSGIGVTYEPASAAVAAYQRLYDVYRDIYPSNRAVFAKLAEAVR